MQLTAEQRSYLGSTEEKQGELIKYCGTNDDKVGPVSQKLSSYGDLMCLVVGAFGEASEDVHLLIHSLANHRREDGAQKRRQPERGGDGLNSRGVQEADEPDCCQSPG